MLRVFYTIVLPLVLPTAIYVLWITCGPRRGEGIRWGALPWLWLAGGGVLLLAGALIVVITGFGTAQHGVYVPPHVENGVIVPGHIDPTRSR